MIQSRKWCKYNILCFILQCAFEKARLRSAVAQLHDLQILQRMSLKWRRMTIWVCPSSSHLKCSEALSYLASWLFSVSLFMRIYLWIMQTSSFCSDMLLILSCKKRDATCMNATARYESPILNTDEQLCDYSTFM